MPGPVGPSSSNVSGSSGFSGRSGYSGYSGYSGVGTSGYSGYSGLGTSGYSGYSGLGTIGGSTGVTDNRILRADGTGGSTAQTSAVAIDDTGTVIGINGSTTVPAFAFADGVTGFAFDGTDVGIITGGTRSHRIDSAKHHIVSNTAKLVGGTFDGDVALQRDTTARWKITDNGAGFGDLKVRQHYVDATMTAGGTTGAQTINKAAGSVNFATGTSTLVVTNSLVTTNSLVLCVVQTADATAVLKSVVPAAGSFTITLNAATTAETRVAFHVINQ